MNRRSYRLACCGSGNSMWGRKQTLETIKKIRQSKYGKKLNPEHVNRIRLSHLGKPSGMLGKKHSLETREQWSQSRCGFNNPYFGKKHSLEVRKKIGQSKLGSSNPAWRGGCSQVYPLGFDAQYKEMIRQRDNYTCQLCFLLQNGRKLSVHHIDYDKYNLDPVMKISLHTACHTKTSRGDHISWQLLFEDIQRTRGLLL